MNTFSEVHSLAMWRPLGLCLVVLGGCGGSRSHALRQPPSMPRPELGEWSLCGGNGVDLAKENGPALAALAARDPRASHALYDLIVVPGYTPLDATEATPVVHPTAAARLDAAVAHLRGGGAPIILVSGANVHPDGTPYVEAMLMKRYLLEHGVAESLVLVEPCARHSHTNLRNAGRFMLRYGLEKALVVTSRDQAFYFANPRLSGFEERCLADFGYRVGDFVSLPESTVEFRPSANVLRRGDDPRDP